MDLEPHGVAARTFQAFVHAELSAIEHLIVTEYTRLLPQGPQPQAPWPQGLQPASLRSTAVSLDASQVCAWSTSEAHHLDEGSTHPHSPGVQDKVPTSDVGRTRFSEEMDEFVSESVREGSENAAPVKPVKQRSRRTSNRSLNNAWSLDECGLTNPLDFEEDEEREKREQRIKAEKFANAGLFGDLSKMKEEAKTKYDVKAFYKDTGMWQKVARHSLFENITLGIIAINAGWMAIDCDNNDADTLLEADIQFQIAEQAFCFYFVGELVTRFQAFEKKWNCMQDGWFVFDSILVTMMVLETWVMTLALLAVGAGSGGGSPLGSVGIMKLFRLARLSRLLRLLRSMPELLFLVKGMVAAMRSVGFVMLLLMLVTYVFAIAFVQLLRGLPAGDKYFYWLGDAMYTLIMAGTLMDNITFVIDEIGTDSFICAILFVLFVCLSALTVMNMLIGVLCEVVSTVAQCEKEGMLISYVTGRFQEIWDSIDSDGSGKLSKREFGDIIQSRDAWRALEEVDVDPMSLAKMADMIFEDEETGDEKDMTLDEFMEVVLSFRGSNTATVKDINDMRRYLDIHNQKRADHLFMEIKVYFRNILAGLASELGHNGIASKLRRPKTSSIGVRKSAA